MKSIIIPTFTQGVSISIASLISGLGNNTVAVSIVGEDIVGTEESAFSPEAIEKSRRRNAIMSAILPVILIVMMLVMLGVSNLIMRNDLDLKNTTFIADLYLKAKDYDTAIKVYETYKKDHLPGAASFPVTYELASIYALKGDAPKSIFFLKQLDNDYLRNRIKVDANFDAIRSTSEFQDYLKIIKEHTKDQRQ